MPIVEIRTHQVSVPLRTPFVTALRRVDKADSVLVEVRDEDGRSGWGEGTQTWKITGDAGPAITAALSGPLREAVLGKDPDDLEELTRAVASAVVGNTSAKAALDCALHDLAAQRLGVPLARLLGGTALRVPTDVTLAVAETAQMADAAAHRRAEGFTILKVKVGEPGADEVKRLAEIRRAAGAGTVLRLDANQGWSPKQAVRLIRAIEDAGLDIELIEQPVRAGDLDGLAWVTDHVTTPVLADESIWSPADLLRLVDRRAADLVNVKLAKCGGLRAARHLLAIAEAAGVGVIFSSMLESHVGTAAAASLAAAARTPLTADLDAAWWLARSPVQGGMAYDSATIVLPGSPGLGITGLAGDPVPGDEEPSAPHRP
jgi:L-Ala-D/L-Glu epimerase